MKKRKPLRFYLTVLKIHIIEKMNRNNHLFLENIPGQRALWLCPEILEYLSEGVESIVITGTNGKTTTTKFIANILRENGDKIFTNSEGANLIWRITTLYLNNYSLLKGPKKRLAVLECDEGYLQRVIPIIKPKILVVTNIFLDQEPRFKSERNVFKMMYTAMKSTYASTCIINNNCHFIDEFKLLSNWNFIEYDSKSNLIDIYGNKSDLELSVPGQYNVANANAAAKACEILGISENTILKGLKNTKPSFGRFETFNVNGNEIKIVIVKNRAGYNVVSDYIITSLKSNTYMFNNYKNLVIAMDNEDGDTKWLYSITFIELTCLFEKIYICGACKLLLLEILNKQNIVTSLIDIVDLPNIVNKNNDDTLIICNYEAMMNVRQAFIDIGVLKYYWDSV